MTLQTSVGVDRSLPGNFTVTAAWIGSRTWRALRSRVVDVPPALAGTAAVAYQYESTGRMRQDEVVLGINRRFDQRLSLSARYFLGWARSDTDGAGSFPASSADLAAEWGRSSLDVRHRLVLTGSATLPWDVRVSPFLIASSGRPYNITIGRDVNGDTVFTDRPSFASDPSEPGVVAPRPAEAPAGPADSGAARAALVAGGVATGPAGSAAAAGGTPAPP